MKKLILFLSLILSVGFASAQSEIPSDSIRRAPSTNIKEFGGFLLDMGLMNVATPELPKFNLDMPNMTKDYNQLFRLNTDITYSQGFTDSFSSSSYSGFAGTGYGKSGQADIHPLLPFDKCQTLGTEILCPGQFRTGKGTDNDI